MNAARAVLARIRATLRLDHEFSIAEGSALYMAAFLFSAALGVLRQILFNAHFGVGPEANAYYAAFRLPDTIGVLVAGGTISNALIPMLIRVRRAGGDAAAGRLVSLTLATLLVIFTPVALLCAIFAPAIVSTLVAPGFDAPTARLTVDLARVMLMEVLLLVAEGVLVSALTSRNRLALPALAIALRNITLISGILLAMYVPGVGIYGPTLGAVGDALLQLAIIVPGLRRAGLRVRPAWAWRDPDLRATLALLVPNGLSAISNYANTLADTAFASLAREAAALPALANALLLYSLPQRLIGVAIGQATLPHLAAHLAAGDRAALRRDLRRAGLAILGLGLAAVAGLILLGRPVVRLLFERGAFDAAAGDLTYGLLAILALALPASVLTELLTRALIALHDTRSPLLANLLQLALRLAILMPLTPAIGARAIPVAAVAGVLIEALALAAALWWRLGRLRA